MSTLKEPLNGEEDLTPIRIKVKDTRGGELEFNAVKTYGIDDAPIGNTEAAADHGRASTTDGDMAESTECEAVLNSLYLTKTQLDHILLRPDTYIGSIEKVTAPMWVFDKDTETIVQREVKYVPGLYKIFDEIVVNAVDNKQRDPAMDRINVTIDQDTSTISVWNNGNGIPVVMHSTVKMYVPELIFGHLLAGSNFDDGEKKTTVGRNGYGVKLANIFSSEFMVETADSSTGKKFMQVFQSNMGVRNDPKIGAHLEKDYTCITFTPDLAKFKMDSLDDDVVALFSKRVYDVAGCCNSYQGARLQVYLNGKKLPVTSFQEYMGLYQGLEECVAWEKIKDIGKSIVIGLPGRSCPQLSYFVNCMNAKKGKR